MYLALSLSLSFSPQGQKVITAVSKGRGRERCVARRRERGEREDVKRNREKMRCSTKTKKEEDKGRENEGERREEKKRRVWGGVNLARGALSEGKDSTMENIAFSAILYSVAHPWCVENRLITNIIFLCVCRGRTIIHHFLSNISYSKIYRKLWV